MTQYELIEKWRDTAQKLRLQAKLNFDPFIESIDYYDEQAEVYEECANDLEAMTY